MDPAARGAAAPLRRQRVRRRAQGGPIGAAVTVPQCQLPLNSVRELHAAHDRAIDHVDPPTEHDKKSQSSHRRARCDPRADRPTGHRARRPSNALNCRRAVVARIVATAERQSAPPLADAERSRSQETDGGQRCLRHSSHVANPAGGSSIGSLPSSSPGVGMSMLAAHSASSSSDIGHVVCGASAWR